MLNHVLLHQTVIGQEAIAQLELAGAFPDVIVGCVGGGSNFAGLTFPFLRGTLRGEHQIRFVAAEPAACPTLTRGVYAYDFGDTAGLTPLMPMYTLGHDFVPPPVHAGGLRYHGDAPMVCGLVKAGVVEARAYRQNETFEAAVRFARTEGIIPAPEPAHAIRAVIEEAEAAKRGRRGAHDPVRPLRPRPLRPRRLRRLPGRHARGPGVLRGRHAGGARRAAGGHAGDRLITASVGRAWGVTVTPAALRDAALLGGVSGMRTFMAPAVLALRGRLVRNPARYALLAAAAGELAADKYPAIPDRIDPPGLAGRLTSAAVSGRTVAGAPGAALAAGIALAAAAASWRVRGELAEQVPDPLLGAAEDALAISLAWVATRDPHPEPDSDPEPALAPLEAAAHGVLAGAVGTTAITLAQLLAPTESSDAPEQVGRKLIRFASGKRVPRKHRGKLNQGMHWAYGTSWGMLYGLLASQLAKPPGVLAGGVTLGLGVWAVSLVELPALGVAPTPWEQSPGALLTDAGFHLIYGLTSAATLSGLAR